MKILIWDKDIQLRNAGGPSGYLWNLHEFLGIESKSEISFYSDLINSENRAKPILFRIVLRILYILNFSNFANILYNYFCIGKLSEYERNVIRQFDYVHFHSIASSTAYNHCLQKLGCKTILTLHSPEPVINELCSCNSIISDLIKKYSIIHRYFEQKEIQQLCQVSHLMFPVPSALECYTSVSKDYNDFFNLERTRKKIFFVPTCIPDICNSENEYVLDKYNIPKNSLRVCFVGRHTEVKGYNYLQSIAKSVWDRRKDVVFVIGGNSNQSVYPDDNRWIELGWVNTINLLNEIDIFILPNKQTYFDLIALEILRAGVPLITTLTGGNKYLSFKNKGGILFIPNDDVESASNTIANITKDQCKSFGAKNREIFLNNFTMDNYCAQYIYSLNNIKNN